MKSEERHKLQQNELAGYLAKTLEAIKPYQNALLGGVVLVILAFLVMHWMNSESDATRQASNTQFFNALFSSDTSQLQNVSKDFPKSRVAVVADLSAADLYLNRGSDLLFVNKASASSELGKAVGLYEEVLGKIDDPLLLAQAQFGLARAKECQNQLADAQEKYEKIVKQWPDSPFGFLASRRLEELKRPSTKPVFDLIAKMDPKPPVKSDKGGADKKLQFDPANLPPEAPIAPAPKDEKSEGKDKQTGNEATPPAEEKKAEETKPAEEKKTEEKATEEMKADEKKPEETKPAEEKKDAEAPSGTTPDAASAEKKSEPASDGK